MSKRILIVLGHTNAGSLCAALASRYAKAASAANHEVRRVELGELRFDPVLREGYARVQALEPDLQAFQHSVQWAEHLVFVYPIWWGSIPAALKGLLDRTLLPGFGYKGRTNSHYPDRLLKGRSADLLVTMDAPPWYFRWVERMPGIRQMRENTLHYCGIRPVRAFSFGPVRFADAARRERWLAQVDRIARLGS